MSDSAISDFMNITGCQDHSRAKFYIDSSNGDLDAAVIRLLSNIINRGKSQTDFWKTHPCVNFMKSLFNCSKSGPELDQFLENSSNRQF